MADDYPPLRWEVQPAHIWGGLALAIGLVFFAGTLAEPAPDSQPDTVYVPQEDVGSLTSEDVNNLRAYVDLVLADPETTPEQRRQLRPVAQVLDGVGDGTVGLAPEPTVAPPTVPTTTSSTTTTTTAPPLTTAPPAIPTVQDLLDLIGDDFP